MALNTGSVAPRFFGLYECPVEIDEELLLECPIHVGVWMGLATHLYHSTALGGIRKKEPLLAEKDGAFSLQDPLRTWDGFLGLGCLSHIF